MNTDIFLGHGSGMFWRPRNVGTKKGNGRRRNRIGNSKTEGGTLNRGRYIIQGACQGDLDHRGKQVERFSPLVCVNIEDWCRLSYSIRRYYIISGYSLLSQDTYPLLLQPPQYPLHILDLQNR